jgi:hypothetical protein
LPARSGDDNTSNINTEEISMHSLSFVRRAAAQAAAVCALTLAMSAHAAPTVFNFATDPGSPASASLTSCGANCFSMSGSGGFAGTDLFSVLDFTFNNGVQSGTWSFDNGTDLLAGTFSASFSQFTDTAFAGSLSYVVTETAGTFAGLTGGGTSTVSGVGDGPGFYNYTEQGSLTLNAVAAVPEPSTYALLGLGLAFCGYQVRRRKA